MSNLKEDYLIQEETIEINDVNSDLEKQQTETINDTLDENNNNESEDITENRNENELNSEQKEENPEEQKKELILKEKEVSKFVFEKPNKDEQKEVKDKKISIPLIILITILFSFGSSLCICNLYFQRMIHYISLNNKTAHVSIADSSLQVDFSDDENFADMIESVMPSVVSITGTITTQYGFGDIVQSFDSEASGSGAIVGFTEEEILIVTNYHVIEDLNNISVGFTNNTTATNCYVKAKNQGYDLAIIAIKTDSLSNDILKYIKIATISKSEPILGSETFVIGNSLGYGISVTKGIVSANNKEISNQRYLQTDAAINEGNSGGPIFNNKGQIIAIANMKLAGTTIEGMGFGIPTSEIYNLLLELMTFEPLDEKNQGYLGISILKVEENYYGIPLGLLVTDIIPNEAADLAGLKQNDVIMKLNGEEITTPADLSETIKNTLAGTPIKLTIYRLIDGKYKLIEITVTLGHRPIDLE